MASTEIDEDFVVSALSLPVSMQASGAMRVAACSMIVDAWDRNVIKGPFIEILTTALPLNDNISRMEVLFGVLKAVQAGTCTENEIMTSIRYLAGKVDEFRKKSLVHMEKLSQCSEDYDPIH